MTFTQYLKSKFPEGSYGGECAAWCHNFAEFAPVGDSYREKKAFVNANGIIMANIPEIGRGFRVGDVIITSEGTTFGFGNGHACILLDLSTMAVAESNFNKDGKVHYGRKVPLNKIYGIIRAPLKVDLGQLEVNVSVLINNQKWKVGFLDDLQKDILKFTDNQLKVNFFPVMTTFNDWWYETTIFPITREEVRVISKAYMDGVALLSFTSENKPSDILIFIVRPDQWEGSISGGQELAYTKGRQIQASCGEFDMSPWYYGLELKKHMILHEISHVLHDINGLNDTTHIIDNKNRQLESVFNDLDFNRIKANL